MVVLEPLSLARANGHRVLAVVAGSAVNQDGASNGLTAPNGPSQQRVIRAALASAGLDPADVDVVEGHGTGTELGDPIEAQALIATYGQGREQGRPAWLGSVKSNIGHTQAAAGAAGVIKMVQALRHEQLPATLHAQEPSPHVDWSAGHVRLLTEPVPWPRDRDRPRRAGVSSFGISGTNAHLVVEEAPGDGPDAGAGWGPAAAGDRPVPVLAGAGAWVVSGRSAGGLAGQAGRLADWVTARPGLDAGDVGWSLVSTRPVFGHRAVVTGRDQSQLVAGLAAVAAGEPAGNVVTGSVPAGGAGKTVFVFAGHGAQWAGMGRDLAAGCPVFAARLAECAAALAPHVGWNLLDVINETEGAPGLEAEDVLQPVLWAVSVALAAVWEAAGVTPDAVAGHSQGEIAAATVAGMLSLQDAALIIAARGRVLAGLGGHGGMLSVAAPPAQVGQVLAASDGRVSVAAVNSPGATVVAGDLDALAELAGVFAERGWRTRPVPIGYAAHSAQVEAAEQELTAALAEVRPGPGRIAMISAMTGELVQGADLDAGYWYASLRAPVQFARTVTALAGTGHGVFIEVSPHPVLAAAITETQDQDGVGVAVTGTLRRQDGGAARLLASLARAHVQGAGVDWAAVLGSGSVVELPTYAFQRERFWPRPVPAGAGDVTAAGLGAVSHPLLGAAVQVAGGDQLVLTGRVSAAAQPWLADHVVGGVVLVPGTALLELAIRAGDAAGCGQVTELALQAPLVLPADGAVQVQVVVGGALDVGRRPVEVFARPAGPGQGGDGAWTCHARGLLSPGGQPGADPQAAADTAGELAVWPPPGAVPVRLDDLYEGLTGAGLGYGPAFRGLRAAWQHGDEVLAEAVLPEAAGDAAGFGLHPALLDAVLHAVGLAEAGGDGAGMMVPFAWTGVALHAAGARVLRARLRRAGDGAITLTAADSAGQPVITVRGLALRPVTAAQLEAARDSGAGQGLLGVDWVPVPAGPPGGAWAVAGPDPYRAAAGLAAAGVPVSSYPDLAALAAAVSEGAPVPDLVAITAVGLAGAGDDAGDLNAGVLAQVLAGQVLIGVQEWLAGPVAGARLVVLTRDAVPARAGDRVGGLAGAGVWGLVRAVQAENPGRVVLADLPAQCQEAGPPCPGPEPREGAELLAAAAGIGEPEVAIRDGQLYGRRLVRPARALPGPDSTRPGQEGHAGVARPAGTVLVTGGTGTLGGLTARHLAVTGRAAACVLVSRSGSGRTREGAAVLAADLARGRRPGRWVLAADLARPGVAAAVTAAAAAGREGRLSAVIHAAGVVDDATIATMTPAQVSVVMAPKAAAAWQLHLATEDADLDEFVLFLFGGVGAGRRLGRGTTAAANAFLDGLAAYRRAAGFAVPSRWRWGLWEQGSAITAGRGWSGAEPGLRPVGDDRPG